MNEPLPSYGGVYLTRHGQQVVCRTGDEVAAALTDKDVVYDHNVIVPALRKSGRQCEDCVNNRPCGRLRQMTEAAWRQGEAATDV